METGESITKKKLIQSRAAFRFYNIEKRLSINSTYVPHEWDDNFCTITIFLHYSIADAFEMHVWIMNEIYGPENFPLAQCQKVIANVTEGRL